MINWHQLGKDIASGKSGTGWMKYSKGDLKDYNGTFEEKVDKCIQGWFETLQWEYEVGKNITKEVGSEIKENDINDAYFDARLEWESGYGEYIMEVEK